MARWIRFEHQGQTGFGTLDGAIIRVHEGDMFEEPRPTGATLPLAEVKVLTPCTPSKMICLWNNFHALAARLGVAEPDEPLYFLKSPSAFLAHGETIRRPPSYSGNVVYEGELGIVIGRRCSNVSEAEAADHIFGYTCVDDVTAADLIPKNPTFAQWARAKSFDTFGVFGPVIATGLDPSGLSIRTVLDGQERQNYPVSDMIFQPHRLVSFLSRDMTLLPGDVIACGTSIGVSAMRGPRHTIEIIDRGRRHLEQPLRAAGAVQVRRRSDQAHAHRRGRRRRDRRPDGGEARGRRPSGDRDRPGRAARRDPGQRPEADLGGRQRAGRQGQGSRERRRGRPAGSRDPRGQGPFPRPGGARDRRHARARAPWS